MVFSCFIIIFMPRRAKTTAKSVPKKVTKANRKRGSIYANVAHDPRDMASRTSKFYINAYQYALNYPGLAYPTKIPYMPTYVSSVATYTKRESFSVTNDGTYNGKYLYFLPTQFMYRNNAPREVVRAYDINAGNGETDPATSRALINSNDMEPFAESVRIVGATMTVDYIDQWNDYSGFIIYLNSQGSRTELFPAQGQIAIEDLYNDSRTGTAKVSDLPVTFRWYPLNYADLEFIGTGPTAENNFLEGVCVLRGTTNGMTCMVSTHVMLEFIPNFRDSWYINGTDAPPNIPEDVFKICNSVEGISFNNKQYYGYPWHAKREGRRPDGPGDYDGLLPGWEIIPNNPFAPAPHEDL